MFKIYSILDREFLSGPRAKCLETPALDQPQQHKCVQH